MGVYKANYSKEDISSSRPAERAGKFKWWFLLLILLGVLSLVFVWLFQTWQTIDEYKKIGTLPFAVSVAYAQEPTGGTPGDFTPRVIIKSGIVTVLGIVYLAGIFRVFFSGNSEQVDAAVDIVKTLTGFFVGAVTGFLS